MLVEIEGITGAGKTTAISGVEEVLVSKGYKVLVAKEPGTTKLGEEIRRLVLKIPSEEISSTAQLLLYMANRLDVLSYVSKKQSRNKDPYHTIILYDRYFGSTYAYQIGVPMVNGNRRVSRANKEILDFFVKKTVSRLCAAPHLSLFLSVVPEVAFERVCERECSTGRNKGHYESREEFLEYNGKVIRGYHKYQAAGYPWKTRTVSASGSISNVRDLMVNLITKMLPSPIPVGTWQCEQEPEENSYSESDVDDSLMAKDLTK